jgi:DNA-directed RNA polymerase specialized sigma24 family protein
MKGSVSQWNDGARQADQAAIGRLWERYFEQLVRLGRSKLAGHRNVAANEEDAAAGAFASFCRAAENGRLPNLDDRDALWRLLMTLTLQKVVDQKRLELRQKRGGGKLRGESALMANATDDEQGFARIMQQSPTPEDAVLAAEEVERLMGVLDDELRAVVLAKLDGYTNREIADRQQRSVSSIERCLRLIRKKWQRELEVANE